MARLRHFFRQSVRAAISLTSRSHLLNWASRSALDTGHGLLYSTSPIETKAMLYSKTLGPVMNLT